MKLPCSPTSRLPLALCSGLLALGGPAALAADQADHGCRISLASYQAGASGSMSAPDGSGIRFDGVVRVARSVGAPGTLQVGVIYRQDSDWKVAEAKFVSSDHGYDLYSFWIGQQPYREMSLQLLPFYASPATDGRVYDHNWHSDNLGAYDLTGRGALPQYQASSQICPD